MKPKEIKPEFVFRVIHRNTGEAQGSYSRSCCLEYDFASPSEARSANCSGVFKDRGRYKVAKYRVTYELIEDNVEVVPTQPKEPSGEWSKEVIEWIGSGGGPALLDRTVDLQKLSDLWVVSLAIVLATLATITILVILFR